MVVLSHDVVIHLEHVVFQLLSLSIGCDHAGRFVPQLVAESPVRCVLAFSRRRTDSCCKGSLGQMGSESRHQRLTAFVEGRQFRAEELQYAVVSLVKTETDVELQRRVEPLMRQCCLHISGGPG